MKSFFNFSCITLIIISLQFKSYSQTKDSIAFVADSTKVSFYFFNPEKGNYELNDSDTLFSGFQKYNPLDQSLILYTHMGNVGLAAKSLIYTPTKTIGFDPGFHAFDGYLNTVEKSRYLIPLKPYTFLNYANGAGREQLFNVHHSQNLQKNLNIGLNYRVINSPGSYFHQKTDHSNVDINLRYNSKNNRYYALGNFIYNRLIIQENGGIESDSYFEDSTHSDRKLIPVRLQEAVNYIREPNYFFLHSYNLNASKPDSINRSMNFGRVYHRFHYKISRELYEDKSPASGFYKNIFLDSALTHDSTHFETISNTFGWSNIPLFNNDVQDRLSLDAGITHSIIYFNNESGSIRFQQLTPNYRILYKVNAKISVFSNGSFVYGEYNDGDFIQNNGIKYDFHKTTGFLKMEYWFKNYRPSFIATRYLSNNFKWDYDFNKQLNRGFKAVVFFKDFETGIQWVKFNDYVYFDSQARPKQLDFTFDLLSISLKYKAVYKKWILDNIVCYQKSYNAGVLRFPEFQGRHAIYYTMSLFNNALKTQIGSEVIYFSGYYADSWMPATRQFYLQNDKQLKSYPQFDIFVNLQIKRANIFIKYQHINAGLISYSYYNIPGYPLQDRALKFGISWKFYD